jgi:hypothetical protein
MRYSKVAYTSQYTVITMNRVMMRSGFFGGQDKTPVLVDERLAGRGRGGQVPSNLVDHLSRGECKAAPFAIAGDSAYHARSEERGLQVLLEGRKHLACIRFARKGGTV